MSVKSNQSASYWLRYSEFDSKKGEKERGLRVMREKGYVNLTLQLSMSKLSNSRATKLISHPG